jgi:hypothetical protein
MSHVDGHCATPGETIYVIDAGPGTCNDTPAWDAPGGTKALPVCSLKAGLAMVTPVRYLLVLRGEVSAGEEAAVARPDGLPVSIVGQGKPTLTALDTVFALRSGAAYLRGLTVDSAFGYGITATGTMLTLDGVTVSGCPRGGILIERSPFDIRNTTVKNNGDASQSMGFGIDVRTLPGNATTKLTNVTVTDNAVFNLSCGGTIYGSGVLAPGSETVTCGLASCVTPGPECGAP